MKPAACILLVFLACWGAGCGLEAGAAEAFDHAPLGRVLRECVSEARVDYRRLKERPADLDAYLGRVAEIPAGAFAGWTRDERLALLINLYNAATLRLVIDHYPLGSLRDLGVLPGAAWRKKVVRFGGRTISLDDLEHGLIRAEYREPRIHFALVCAATGCPPLRGEPFEAGRLGEQLDDQARRFLGDVSKNRFEPETGILWLSPIFDWYAADFAGEGRSVPDAVKGYLPERARRELERAGTVKVRFTDYDWSLNERVNPGSPGPSP